MISVSSHTRIRIRYNAIREDAGVTGCDLACRQAVDENFNLNTTVLLFLQNGTVHIRWTHTSSPALNVCMYEPCLAAETS